MNQNTGDTWVYWDSKKEFPDSRKWWVEQTCYISENLLWRVGPPTLRFVNRVKQYGDKCPYTDIKRHILKLLKGIQ